MAGESVYTPSDVTEDLTAASMWGDVQLLEGFLANGADPNLPNSQGNTALHVACYYGERECASVLLNYKAEVNAKGSDGKTPLHRAVLGVLVLEPGPPKYTTQEQIYENQIDLVKLLVGRGAKVTVKDNADDTPFDLALQCDFYVCAELLSDLAKSEEQEEQRHLFYQKIDDIYEACKIGDLEKMKCLMPAVHSILNEDKKNHKTLLMVASEEGHLPVVEYLIDQGATVTRTSEKFPKTALHFAAENGHRDIVECLVRRLPKVLRYDESARGSALHLASRNGHSEVVELLLEIASRSLTQRTPCKVEDNLESSLDSLSLATQETYTVNVLSQSPIEGRTPLHEAVIGGHTQIVQSLVKWIKDNHNKKMSATGGGLSPLSSPHLGAPPSTQPPVSPRTPQTPLFSSLSRTPTQSTINPLDIMTELGRTPLHEATRLGHTDMVEILQNGGADINAVMRLSLDRTANADLTALVQASLQNDVEMVRFLLQHGATDARLKALTRVLRIPYNDVAGLLLCYNGAVTVDSGNIELRKRAGKETSNSPLFISVNWSSKNLPYITPEWLEGVLLEAPKPKAEFYGISQLNLSDNKLSELPIAIFQLKYLIRLEISRNNISTLPVTCPWECHNLTHFDVSHNHLTTLPTVLFTLPELKELICTSNAIRELPLELWFAPKLTKLVLQKNRLTSFPSPSLSSDSGFGTWEATPPAEGVLNSFSIPDFSFIASAAPLSPPLRNVRTSRRDSLHILARNRLQTSPTGGAAILTGDRRISLPPSTNILRSRLRELFDTSSVEDDPFDDYELAEVVESAASGLGGAGKKEGKFLFQLETLDLAYNELTSIPHGLSCLAPKLLKLNIHHNKLSSLGSITDFPADLELLDACNNSLTTTIACARPRELLRNLTCPQKLLQLSSNSLSVSQENMTPTRCSHRNHRVLRKLSYLKLAHNNLVDVQLFRTSERGGGPMTELTSSIDETRFNRRTKTSIDIGGSAGSVVNISGGQREFSRSSYGGKAKDSLSSTEEGSGDDKRGSSTVDVLYCLYPQLSTLDLGYNLLRSVPAHLHLIGSLAVLTISHNTDIDTLPLELSNLEGLWSLEYDGVPLTNPPASDLDKFRSASDKLLYMRQLLHDAKPYESMKLMLVGLQKQGKTTLLSRLREINEVKTPVSTFNERIEGETVMVAASVKPSGSFFKKGTRDAPLSTVGVDLGVWKYRKDLEPTYKGKKTSPLRSVTFYTWDFGGQEEYYATHQCFLSNRSLYLVIFNSMDGEDGIDNLGLWLHNIQARAPESPVVIVGTHCDLLKGEVDKETRKSELFDYLKEKYHVGETSQKLRELGLPLIKEVMFVGCPMVGRAEGVTELRTTLWDTAFNLTAPRKKGMIGGNRAKLLEQPIPSSYLKLEERVRELVMECQSRPDLSPVKKEHEFYELVQDIIPNSRELNQAVTFLHENGVLLHYATPALNHLYFIDPQWLCDMLAHVVTVPEVNRFIQRGSGPEAGILKTSVLSHIFKGKLFPHALRNEYIELLSKFEVALLLDRNRMLVPSMLPSAPLKTIYHFKTLFPRPPISYLLQQARTNNNYNNDDDSLTQYSSLSDPLAMSSIPKTFSMTKMPDLYRTGLLLRRYYFMTYVPSGFWPRLISRFLTAPEFANIVLKALGFSEKEIQDIVKLIISGDASTVINLEWSYWTSGVELWYHGYSLLRVCEIRPEGTFQDCLPPSSQGNSYSRTPLIPFEPYEDCDDLSFQLNGQWLAVNETPNTGLEILVPDYICPSIIEKEISNLLYSKQRAESDEEPLPLRESSWMSAQLLSLIVQQIDTLLEDWFPGIGSKDSAKSLYSVPYVNRVVPCPYCVGKAEIVPNDVFVSQSYNFSDRPTTLGSLDGDTPTPTGTVSSHNDESELIGVKVRERVRRDLMPSLQKTMSQRKKHPESIDRKTHDRSLSPPPPPPPPLEVKGNSDGLLIQATRFGFMIEACVGASRGLIQLVCPSHPSQPLDIFSLTPDLVFGDLPSHFIIDDQLVNKGQFVASGSFGEIYHGAIYPQFAVSEDDGREVAIKIDKQDRKHFNMETATKAYMEIRAEVALLKDLHHDNIIQFIGLTLRPLCFMLEWASQGSLHGILESYKKADARISPWTLVETTRQVASGLAYLHSRSVVYYDLKSPNILVFNYPSPDQSLQASLGYSPLVQSGKFSVCVKIADLGISRKLTPGGVVGYKGTPAFMAPEILRYVGKEACTEKVDVFSFGMFMYELLAQQFPFERQNLMHNQIEKLVVDGERPSIQSKELSNPILYLDIMRWAWEQDYHNRPSAQKLETILEGSAIPHLVDAYSMKGNSYQKISSSCVVTLPIDISAQISSEDNPSPSGSSSSGPENSLGPPPSFTSYHANVVRGDLQEEVWFCSEEKDSSNDQVSCCLSIVSFRGRGNFIVECLPIDSEPITAMCSVNQQVWLGSENGQLILYDALNHSKVFSRYLAVNSSQGILSIDHLTKLRQVLVVRCDGYLLLLDEDLLEQKIPDTTHFDNHLNMTQLPVRTVFNFRSPIYTTLTIHELSGNDSVISVWCTQSNEVITVLNIGPSSITHAHKLQGRSYAQTSKEDYISHLCHMKLTGSGWGGGGGKRSLVWALSYPDRMMYLWENYKLVLTHNLDQFTADKVTDIVSLNNMLYISTSMGHIIVLSSSNSLELTTSCTPVIAHDQSCGIYKLLTLGTRVFPRHWIPTLIGRNNVIEYYRDLLEEEEVEEINSQIIGSQSQLILTLGRGFNGLASCKKIDSSLQDRHDNFLLLWLPPR